MDNTLPIDPRLADIGAGLPFQTLVFGQVFEARAEAFVVATLVQEHAEGIVGRYYGTRLRGIAADDRFVPWRTIPLGEVRWDEKQGWVQVGSVAA